VTCRSTTNDYHPGQHPYEGSDGPFRIGCLTVNTENASEAPEQNPQPGRAGNILIALGCAVVVVGVVLRFVAPSPLWLDEALSVHITQGQMPLTDALRQDGHPALYYLLLGWWIDLFGESDVAVRSLSGVFGLLTLISLGAAGRRYGRTLAGTLVVIAASSPFLIGYSVEARMYSLVTLLVASGFWALQRAWDRPNFANLTLVTVLAALAVHTHYWLTLMIVAAALTTIEAARRRGEIGKAVRPVAALAVGSATLVIWLPILFAQLAHTGTPWATRARPAEIFIETLQALGGSTRFEGEALGLALSVLILIGAFAIAPLSAVPMTLSARFENSVAAPAAAIIIGLGLATGIGFAAGSGFEPRYASIVTPLLLLLAARGIQMLGKPVGTVALVAIVVLGLAVSTDNLRRDRSQGQEAAEWINGAVAAGDIVLFCPDQVGPATVRYLNTDVERRAYPTGDGYVVDWRDYLETAASIDPVQFARAASTATGDGTIWLVQGTGYHLIDPSCALLAAELSNLRPMEGCVPFRPVFEHMSVFRFPAS